MIHSQLQVLEEELISKHMKTIVEVYCIKLENFKLIEDIDWITVS